MPQPDLITLTEPRSPVSEAYRTLRTSLEFSGLDRPLHSLLVTSPAADEGKAVVLANLAVIMAEGGRQVILVEGDLRKPALHDLFGANNDRGLCDLVQDKAVPDSLPLQESGIDGIKLLTSGSPSSNPSVLLGSDRMKTIIQALTEQADLVLFSAPPVIAVTDAVLLAAQVDGTLLIVRAGGTERAHAQRAKALLEKVNANLVGAVLTNASGDSVLKNYYKERS
jgi:non-specific protein-tyrosine kinase